MQVRVKLFATLRINREKEALLDLPEGTTVGQIIENLNIKKEEVTIIFVNGRSAKLDHNLANDDTLSLFPPVGGG